MGVSITETGVSITEISTKVFVQKYLDYIRYGCFRLIK